MGIRTRLRHELAAMRLALETRRQERRQRALEPAGRLAARGEWQRAVSAYQREIDLCRRRGADYAQLRKVLELSVVYRRLGSSEDALACAQRAFALARRNDDRGSEALALALLGLACNRVGGHEQAIGYYEQALARFRELGARDHAGRVVANLAQALERLGEAEQAQALREEALALLEEGTPAHERLSELVGRGVGARGEELRQALAQRLDARPLHDEHSDDAPLTRATAEPGGWASDEANAWTSR